MAEKTMKAEKDADLVMATNNSSIVSKRSVESHYYSEPHFFRYFVRKPQRRAPLINRGYWLRMYAVAESIRRFLKTPTDRKRFILNLGCGFDPLPFQFLSNEKSLCNQALFIDVDYEKLMINKRNVIHETKALTEALEDVEFLPDDSVLLVRSKHYIGIGCDLKNLQKLDDALRMEPLLSQSSILFVAEVSLTYMDIQSADEVIRWASKLSNQVQFCLLEQFLPDGPEHPFAATMMKHFRKLHAPLLSILEYHSLGHQERRFLDAGWSYVRAQSLWDLWQDNAFISRFRKIWLDTIEPFDEWEEFAIFASHYFLLWASTDVEIAQKSDLEQTQANFPNHREASAFPLRLLPNCPPRFAGRRRYGALVSDSDRTLGFYGGLGQKSRLSSTDLYTNSDNALRPLRPLPPPDIASRMCHTATSLQSGECLITGGRTSPSAPMSDCWVRQIGTWNRCQGLPLPRFRHCATPLSFNDNVDHVLVYGGKSESGDILSDWLLWHAQSGWRNLEVVGHKPSARFGATMINTNGSSGVLFGGMTLDGRVLEDFWTWSVTLCGDGPMVVQLANHTESLQTTTPLYKFICRFGATVTVTSWGLVITGGIGIQGVVPSEYEIMILDLQSHSSAMETPWSNAVLCAVGLGMEFTGPRPLLIGHAAWAVNRSELLVLGGGGVCFSFGTFWNEGTWLLQDKTSLAENRWLMAQETEYLGESLVGTPLAMAPEQYTKLGGLKPISRRSISCSAEFQEIVAQARPVVITDADIGRCATLWTKEYLANTIGVDRKVVVHEAFTDHMNFQNKNFSYVTKPFGTFLDEVYAGGLQYLRTISTEQPSKVPANLATDFPELKDDFYLPTQLSFASNNAHSSPLRISGPVAMWLHYDVMANVLCQIRGEKRLILYPPADVQHLRLPAGASSSTIDIFQSTSHGSIASIPHTTPHEVMLKPGDILFIPPLWLHAASPVGGVSIAVNVFFRNLLKGYSVGRDVYANRDLQAYDKGRIDVQKISRSFEGLPHDMAQFYLLRLADELRESASKLIS